RPSSPHGDVRVSTTRQPSAPVQPEGSGLDTDRHELDASRSDLTKLARGGSLNLVGGLVRGVLSFLLVLVITHGLHSAGTGIFFEAVAVFTILTSVGDLGASAGLVREVS